MSPHVTRIKSRNNCATLGGAVKKWSHVHEVAATAQAYQ